MIGKVLIMGVVGRGRNGETKMVCQRKTVAGVGKVVIQMDTHSPNGWVFRYMGITNSNKT